PTLLNNFSYSLAERGIRLEEALEMANRALELEPNNGAFLDTVGWIYFKLGDYQQALYYIKRAVEHREGSAEVLEHLGDVYYQLGEQEKAQEYWQKAYEKDPDNKALKAKIKP
ncbi:MAG: tetratricopeptide repeat protein, partial [Calditrichaeota bacterium]